MGIELGHVVDGKYRVTSRIGEGGMGAVYAGEHLKLHRKVAIKVLHAAVANDPEVVSRFEREAQAAGRIGNDHILEVFDIGELPEGDRYMVMEFLEGEPMNARLSRLGRVAPRQLYPLVRQILEGLGAAHAAGIVHRDLKPANIFILSEKMGLHDYVKIIDFGISKFQSVAGDAQHNQTRTGTIIGTPSYMAPEQARGLREADARSDIYAVGVILYEAVSGRCPFEGASTNDLLFKIFLDEPPAIETIAQDVDPAFCTIIMKALAKEPSERFARAEDFLAALDAWAQSGEGVSVVKQAGTTATLIERPPAMPTATSPAPRSGMTPLPATQSVWADSRMVPAGVPSRRSQGTIVAALAVCVLVLAAGAAALATRWIRSDVAAAPPAATSVVTSHPPPPPALSPAPVTPASQGREQPTAVAAAPADAPPSSTAIVAPPPEPGPTMRAAPSASVSASPPARPHPHAPKSSQPAASTANPFEDR